MKPEKPTNWVGSLNCAIEGILWATRSERHVRYHFVAALAVIFLALFFKASFLEFYLLVVAAVIVIFAEMMNTAVEAIVDLVTEEHHELAKIAKDVAAGAVLITSVGAIALGYLVLSGHIFEYFEQGPTLITPPSGTIPVGSLLVVVILVILIKSRYNHGTPLQGGMPSGHTAVAFSVAMSTLLYVDSLIIGILVLLLAVVVSQSRLLLRIHSRREVLFGAILGSTVTLLIWLVFS